MAKVLKELQGDPGISNDLREAGRRNAAHFPPSATAVALAKLDNDIA
ncbi:hypothetical protein ACIBK9_12110 [Nonomuraea sp. NPDC050227]